jgi:hypothetical protein
MKLNLFKFSFQGSSHLEFPRRSYDHFIEQISDLTGLLNFSFFYLLRILEFYSDVLALYKEL